MLEMREFFMQFFSCFLVNKSGIFFIFKKSKVHFYTIGLNHGAPISVRMTVYTFITASVLFAQAAILHVLCVSSISNIIPPIIFLIVVTMVYLMFGPTAFNNHISNSVCKIYFASDAYNQTALAIAKTGDSACFCPRGAIDFPMQNASTFIIPQNGAHKGRCKIVARFTTLWFVRVSHSILQRSGWLEAGQGVISAFLPRYSIGGANAQ